MPLLIAIPVGKQGSFKMSSKGHADNAILRETPQFKEKLAAKKRKRRQAVYTNRRANQHGKIRGKS